MICLVQEEGSSTLIIRKYPLLPQVRKLIILILSLAYLNAYHHLSFIGSNYHPDYNVCDPNVSSCLLSSSSSSFPPRGINSSPISSSYFPPPSNSSSNSSGSQQQQQQQFLGGGGGGGPTSSLVNVNVNITGGGGSSSNPSNVPTYKWMHVKRNVPKPTAPQSIGNHI
jgi:hypothetical protein